MMRKISESRCFGGVQGVYAHASEATGGEMTFGLFLPPAAEAGPVPILWFLAGLTCTHENAMVKAGLQAHAARAGLALGFPDTSPRGPGVADDPAIDLGQGAGFYLDATEPPWSAHYRMRTYVSEELPRLVARHFPVDGDRQGITGHSMGGHGALTLGLSLPGRYRSLSAFAPICNPTRSDWGRRQLVAYLGEGEARHAAHDATLLVAQAGFAGTILIDTGTADPFAERLGTAAFAAAAAARGQAMTLRLQPGYDHSYFFVATFAADHVAHHAAALRA
jgi:S-formylglutathione hydrolase